MYVLSPSHRTDTKIHCNLLGIANGYFQEVHMWAVLKRPYHQFSNQHYFVGIGKNLDCRSSVNSFWMKTERFHVKSQVLSDVVMYRPPLPLVVLGRKNWQTWLTSEKYCFETPQVRTQPGSQVPAQLRPQVRAQVRAQVRPQVRMGRT